MAEKPTASVSTNAYSFCRFAAAMRDESDAGGADAPADAPPAAAPASAPLVALPSEDACGIELWDLHSGKVAGRARAPPPVAPPAVKAGLLGALCLSPDGRLLLSGHEDGGVRLWDGRALGRGPLASTAAPLLLPSCRGGDAGGSPTGDHPILSLACDPQFRRGAAGFAGPSVALFRASAAAGTVSAAPAPAPAAPGDGPHKEKDAAASASAPASAPAPLLLRVASPDAPSSACGASSLRLRCGDGGSGGGSGGGALRLLACAGWDGRVRLWAFPSGQPLASLRFHKGAATDVAFAPAGAGGDFGGGGGGGTTAVASCGRDGRIAVWHLWPQKGGGGATPRAAA